MVKPCVQTRSNSIASDERSGQEYEPGREDVRITGQVLPYPVRQHPAVCADLIMVRTGLTGIATLKNVQVFVLDQARGWIYGSILKLVNLLEWHREAKLFPKPPACRCECLLTRTRVPATCIRPAPGEVILMRSPPLQEKFAVRVGDQNGKCPMQLSSAMRVDLVARADHVVLRIDQRNGLKLVTQRIFSHYRLCSHHDVKASLG